MKGIIFSGNPEEVLTAIKTLAIAFKGSTLAEALTIINTQQIKVAVDNQIDEILRGLK